MANTDKIRFLNDELRRTFQGGQVVVTPGVIALDALPDILNLVRSFDAFTSENDPWSEHDFGGFVFRQDQMFWKIDVYDPDLIMASSNPADPSVSTRVLTIMLANEY